MEQRVYGMEHLHDNTESSKSSLTGQDVCVCGEREGEKNIYTHHPNNKPTLLLKCCLVCNDHRHMAYIEVYT